MSLKEVGTKAGSLLVPETSASGLVIKTQEVPVIHAHVGFKYPCKRADILIA